MTTRPVFLRTPYSAYDHREVPREDEELTHVGPGTPCGEYMRRFWQPIAYTDELQDLPLAVKIFGEKVVVFRDQNGRVGCLELHCPHRGTSLEFGLVSARGIRCCYHGWLFDVDGTILETPGEPPDSTLKDRLCHGAHPTYEYKGLVFVYMGPPEKKPAFPLYDTFDLPGYRVEAGYRYGASFRKNLLPCNWLQIKENSMDPVHTAFLHTIVSGNQFTAAYGDVGTIDFRASPVGMVYIHTRRHGKMVWVHMNDFIPPNIHQFPPTWQEAREEQTFLRPMATMWHVPIDDTQTMAFTLRRWPAHLDPKIMAPPPDLPDMGQTGMRPYEARQRRPGDYDAFVSQRPIAIHALEHLGSTDRGVIMFRNLVREGIRAVQRGADPKGLVWQEGGVLATYANDTVLRLPPAPTKEEDLKLLRETGWRVAEGYLNDPPAYRDGTLRQV